MTRSQRSVFPRILVGGGVPRAVLLGIVLCLSLNAQPAIFRALNGISPASPTFTFITSAPAVASSDGGNTVTSATVNAIGANFAGVCATTYSGGATPTIADGLGTIGGSSLNTYSSISFADNNEVITLFWSVLGTTGSNLLWKVTTSGGFPAIVPAVFSGATASPADNHADNSNVSSPGTSLLAGSAALTASVGNALYITCAGSETGAIGGSFTIGSSYSLVGTKDVVSGESGAVGMAYFIQGATPSALNPLWSWPSSQEVTTLHADFKP
jgi:hypothetical protein